MLDKILIAAGIAVFVSGMGWTLYRDRQADLACKAAGGVTMTGDLICVKRGGLLSSHFPGWRIPAISPDRAKRIGHGISDWTSLPYQLDVNDIDKRSFGYDEMLVGAPHGAQLKQKNQASKSRERGDKFISRPVTEQRNLWPAFFLGFGGGGILLLLLRKLMK